MDTIDTRLSLLSWGWPDLRGPAPRWFWTLLGATAIPLWATWPTIATLVGAMPVFQFLAISFATGWAVLALVERREAPPASPGVRRLLPFLPALACALGLFGSDAFFLAATAHIPAAQANLIAFLWPVMVVALGAAIGLFRLRPRHAAVLGLGFLGAFVVIGAEDVVFSGWGIALAAAGGLSWALFCLFRIKQGPAAGGVLADGCGLSALLSLGLHLALETPAWPAPEALLVTVASGIAPLALANLAWDVGIRRGDGRTLAVMAYATPL